MTNQARMGVSYAVFVLAAVSFFFIPKEPLYVGIAIAVAAVGMAFHFYYIYRTQEDEGRIPPKQIKRFAKRVPDGEKLIAVWSRYHPKYEILLSCGMEPEDAYIWTSALYNEGILKDPYFYPEFFASLSKEGMSPQKLLALLNIGLNRKSDLLNVAKNDLDLEMVKELFEVDPYKYRIALIEGNPILEDS